MAANLRTAEVGDMDKYVPWFAPDDELAAAVALRKNYYAEKPEKILHESSENHEALFAAAMQLLELQADYLSEHHPDKYLLARTADSTRVITNKVTNDTYHINAEESNLHPLAISGLLGQEDICLVEETNDERHILAAGFVATPTDWELTKLAGKDMDQIHLGFDGYEERLKKVVDDTLRHLPEFPAMKYRNNEFLDYAPTLALFPDEKVKVDASTISNPGNEITLRSERETLIRLPASEANPDKKRLVFTIKPHVLTLSEATRRMGDRKLKKLVEAIQKNTVLHRNEELADIALRYLTDYRL